MTDFNYVFYGKISVNLKSFLHIGGVEEGEIVKDGTNTYIIPASSIAGAIKGYFSKYGKSYDEYLGSSKSGTKGQSHTYYYDAICRNCNVEKRTGICIDSTYGVAKKEKLHNRAFLSEGMETDLLIQVFLREEKEVTEFENIFNNIVKGISEQEILLGSNKSTGAGRFDVLKYGSVTLNLSKPEDFISYLTGVPYNFESVPLKEIAEKNLISEAVNENYTEFILKAEIRDGILVKSGIEHETMEFSLTGEAVAVNETNMRKLYRGKNECYIPGSAVKGILRGYAEKILGEDKVESPIINELFGGEIGENNVPSQIMTEDVMILDAKSIIRDRILIDRFSGGAINGAKMNHEEVFTKEGNYIYIRICNIMQENSEKKKILNAIIFFTLRDIGFGLLPVGSASSIGLGRIYGISMKIDDSEIILQHPSNQQEQAGDVNYVLDMNDDMKKEIEEWIVEVQKYVKS